MIVFESGVVVTGSVNSNLKICCAIPIWTDKTMRNLAKVIIKLSISFFEVNKLKVLLIRSASWPLCSLSLFQKMCRHVSKKKGTDNSSKLTSKSFQTPMFIYFHFFIVEIQSNHKSRPNLRTLPSNWLPLTYDDHVRARITSELTCGKQTSPSK